MLIITGASGFIGREFKRQLAGRGIAFHELNRSRVNIHDVPEFTGYLRSLRADFLINCAGFTGRPNVDACELHKTECLRANAVLPGIIRQSCDYLKLPWGHISSGCIFTGRNQQGLPFTELDTPNFSFRQGKCSFYSGTKALGEEMLRGAESTYIWRLRIPFNEIDFPRNYLSKLIQYQRLLDAENSLTHLGEFVSACLDCWLNKLPFGTYNLTNPGSVTTRQVVRLIQQHGHARRPFNFFRDEDEFMRLAAKTPRSNCVLDSSKALAHRLRLSPVEDAIENSLRNWIPANVPIAA